MFRMAKWIVICQPLFLLPLSVLSQSHNTLPPPSIPLKLTINDHPVVGLESISAHLKNKATPIGQDDAIAAIKGATVVIHADQPAAYSVTAIVKQQPQDITSSPKLHIECALGGVIFAEGKATPAPDAKTNNRHYPNPSECFVYYRPDKATSAYGYDKFYITLAR